VRGALAVLAVGVLLAAGCGGSDDDSSKDDSRDASTTKTKTDTSTNSDVEAADEGEVGEPTAVPEPVPEGEQAPIVVTKPAPFEQLVGSFVLSGSASVFEGALTWAILDARLKPMVTGNITASCGAPCRGTFRTRISLAKVPVGSWELHVWAPNASGQGNPRQHDAMVPVSVATQRTPGAPDPGTMPPGGAPQG
jgi:hypothetical protein